MNAYNPTRHCWQCGGWIEVLPANRAEHRDAMSDLFADVPSVLHVPPSLEVREAERAEIEQLMEEG